VNQATTGTEAVDECAKALPELTILDVMMPEMDGLIACRMLRSLYPELPILMLTARHEWGTGSPAWMPEAERLPWSSRTPAWSCSARVRAFAAAYERIGCEGSARVPGSPARSAVTTRLAGRPQLELTKTEFDLLELLMWNADLVLSRETLYERIWGMPSKTSSRSLDVYVGYLRKQAGSRR